jgi:hypothetical protein
MSSIRIGRSISLLVAKQEAIRILPDGQPIGGKRQGVNPKVIMRVVSKKPD